MILIIFIMLNLKNFFEYLDDYVRSVVKNSLWYFDIFNVFEALVDGDGVNLGF